MIATPEVLVKVEAEVKDKIEDTGVEAVHGDEETATKVIMVTRTSQVMKILIVTQKPNLLIRRAGRGCNCEFE